MKLCPQLLLYPNTPHTATPIPSIPLKAQILLTSGPLEASLETARMSGRVPTTTFGPQDGGESKPSHNSIAPEIPTLYPDPLLAPGCEHFLLRGPQGSPCVSLTLSCKLKSSREEEIPGNPSLGVWKKALCHSPALVWSGTPPVPTSPDRCVQLPSPIAAPMAYKSRG